MIIVSSAFAFLLAGQAGAPAPEATAPPAVQIPAKPTEPTLEQVRAATERFRDVKAALAEGYVRDPTDICETAELMGKPASLGAMGIHFAHPELLGFRQSATDRVDGNGMHTDFLKPGVLIYEPQADGTLQLVAVENLVFLKSWEEAGNTAPPTYQGVAYDRMVDDAATKVDEAHMFEPHYDRHVWLYRDNPNGIFAQFNPNVSCKAHKSGGHSHVAAAPSQ